MATKTPLHLRVNSITISNVKVRPKLKFGVPSGQREVVVEDPRLGWFAVDDSFILEATTDRRKAWQVVSVIELLTIIDAIVAKRKTTPPSGGNFITKHPNCR